MGKVKFKSMVLVPALALILIAYQNCSPVDFGTQTAASVAKSDDPDNPAEEPAEGDGLPPADEPPKNDDGDDVAEDDDNNPAPYASGKGCLFGGNTEVIYDSLPVDTAAQDKSYKDLQGAFHEIDGAKNLTLESISGSVSVKRAENLVLGSGLQGAFHRLVSREMGKIEVLHSAFNLINAQKVGSVLDVQSGGLKLTAHEVGMVEKVRGAFLCLNAQSVTKILNVEGAFITISGRQENDVRGQIQSIRHLYGAFVNIARFQVDDLGDLKGNIHIKDSHIKLMTQTTGNLIIENSEIDSLEDHQGNIILKNSKIANKSKVSGLITEVP